MQVTLAQDNLNKSLQLASRVVATRSASPVLSHVLLEADKTGLTLVATNLEIGLRIAVGGKVETTGRLTIPAKTLTEYIGSLPSGNITLTAQAEKLTVVSGKARAQFSGIAANEFPALPKPSNKKQDTVTIAGKTLHDIASQVAFAASVDDGRPVLTGIRFSVSGERLIITGTDGFRLSQKVIPNTDYRLPETGLILPAKTIQELARVVEGVETIAMEETPENNQVIFSCGPVQVISRVLEGNFPDVSKVIPSEHKTQAIVDRQEWLRGIRAAGIFARENNNIIKFTINNSQLIIKATASQLGENENQIEAEVEGEDNEMAFNYKYLLDFLNSVNSERVIFRLTDKLSPGVFLPEKDDSLIHVIMPVRI